MSHALKQSKGTDTKPCSVIQEVCYWGAFAPFYVLLVYNFASSDFLCTSIFLN